MTEEEWLLVAAVVRAAEYRSWSDNTAVYSDPLSSLLPRHPVHLQEAHLWPHLDISTPQNTCAMIQGFSQHCMRLIYIKLDIRHYLNHLSFSARNASDSFLLKR